MGYNMDIVRPSVSGSFGVSGNTEGYQAMYVRGERACFGAHAAVGAYGEFPR